MSPNQTGPRLSYAHRASERTWVLGKDSTALLQAPDRDGLLVLKRPRLPKGFWGGV